MKKLLTIIVLSFIIQSCGQGFSPKEDVETDSCNTKCDSTVCDSIK